MTMILKRLMYVNEDKNVGNSFLYRDGIRLRHLDLQGSGKASDIGELMMINTMSFAVAIW